LRSTSSMRSSRSLAQPVHVQTGSGLTCAAECAAMSKESHLPEQSAVDSNAQERPRVGRFVEDKSRPQWTRLGVDGYQESLGHKFKCIPNIALEIEVVVAGSPHLPQPARV